MRLKYDGAMPRGIALPHRFKRCSYFSGMMRVIIKQDERRLTIAVIFKAPPHAGKCFKRFPCRARRNTHRARGAKCRLRVLLIVRPKYRKFKLKSSLRCVRADNALWRKASDNFFKQTLICLRRFEKIRMIIINARAYQKRGIHVKNLCLILIAFCHNPCGGRAFTYARVAAPRRHKPAHQYRGIISYLLKDVTNHRGRGSLAVRASYENALRKPIENLCKRFGV